MYEKRVTPELSPSCSRSVSRRGKEGEVEKKVEKSACESKGRKLLPVIADDKWSSRSVTQQSGALKLVRGGYCVHIPEKERCVCVSHRGEETPKRSEPCTPLGGSCLTLVV